MLQELNYGTLESSEALSDLRRLLVQGERGFLLRHVPLSLLSTHLPSAESIVSSDCL